MTMMQCDDAGPRSTLRLREPRPRRTSAERDTLSALIPESQIGLKESAGEGRKKAWSTCHTYIIWIVDESANVSALS